MPEITVIVPGRIEGRTGGYEYDRRIVAGLRARGQVVHVRELDPGFPRPTPEALRHAAAVLAAIPDGGIALVDGLALGAMPAVLEPEASRLNLVALIHLPLADAPGLDAESAAAFRESEKRALATASLVITTGRSTAQSMRAAGVAPDRIAVVEPGTDAVPLARGSNGSPLRLLSVGAVTPGKGHEILIRALAACPHRNWLLTCAGSLDRDPGTVARVRALLRRHNLEGLVSLEGELDAASVETRYQHADVFVLATLHETFCMAVAEALAHGLPVVSTTTGAIPAMAGGGAGLLVPPGDEQALTAALTDVLGDAGLRARLGEGARAARDRLPTWDDALDHLVAALARAVTAHHVA